MDTGSFAEVVVNVEALGQAARQRSEQVPELVLVGAREHLPEPLQQLAGLHVVSDLTDAQLHAVYQHAERLWQPSYAEGFGLPVIEALSVGTSVAVASGSALDEITPAQSPRFSPTDTQALTALMVTLANQGPEDAGQMKSWATRYADEAYRQRFNTLLEELR